MDPTTNLTDQLRLARRLLSERSTIRTREADADRLAELVIALNEWITRGGFLPIQWGNKR